MTALNTDPLRTNWAALKRGEVFLGMNSSPEEWRYDGGCEHVEDEVQCQLCETMINYRFPLERVSGGTQKLMIGRECVVNFYEAYFPDGLQTVLDFLDQSFKTTKKEVIAAKVEAFRAMHPTLTNFLLDSPASKKREFRTVRVPGEMEGLFHHVSTAKFRAALKRRGYLKPDEIAALTPNLEAWLVSVRITMSG